MNLEKYSAEMIVDGKRYVTRKSKSSEGNCSGCVAASNEFACGSLGSCFVIGHRYTWVESSNKKQLGAIQTAALMGPEFFIDNPELSECIEGGFAELADQIAEWAIFFEDNIPDHGESFDYPEAVDSFCARINNHTNKAGALPDEDQLKVMLDDAIKVNTHD